jgi:hypothetical protein
MNYLRALLSEIRASLDTLFTNRQKAEYKTIDRLKTKHQREPPAYNNEINEDMFYESPRRKCFRFFYCYIFDIIVIALALQVLSEKAVEKWAWAGALIFARHRHNTMPNLC